MTSESKLRYGVIGCGVVGPVHADAVCRCPGAELRAVCDIIPERAERVGSEFGAAVYEDFARMVEREELDAVSVCTPHHNHAEITVESLKLGAHVLCEKPLGMSGPQMDAMIATAEAESRTLGGIFQHRFDPVTATIKEAVDAGLFGRVLNAGASIRCYRGPGYYAGAKWRGTWEGEGGAVLINQCIHSIDVLQWLAGPAYNVFGRWANLSLADDIEAEDTASAVVEFASGGIGTIEATSASHLSFEACVHFFGTRGSFRMSTGGMNDLEFLRMADQESRDQVAAMLAARKELVEKRNRAFGKSCYGNSHARQVADFVDAVRNGKAPRVTGRDARHAVDIVLGIYESQRRGQAVALAEARDLQPDGTRQFVPD